MLKFKVGDRVRVRFAEGVHLHATITAAGLTKTNDLGMVTPYEFVYDYNPGLGPCQALEEKLEHLSLLEDLAVVADDNGYPVPTPFEDGERVIRLRKRSKPSDQDGRKGTVVGTPAAFAPYVTVLFDGNIRASTVERFRIFPLELYEKAIRGIEVYGSREPGFKNDVVLIHKPDGRASSCEIYWATEGRVVHVSFVSVADTVRWKTWKEDDGALKAYVQTGRLLTRRFIDQVLESLKYRLAKPSAGANELAH